jgi:hypothetical protein
MKHTPSKHTDFVIERDFAATPEAVFQAWADPQAKRRWSDCHAEHTTEYRLDFRPFGHEAHRVVYLSRMCLTIAPIVSVLYAPAMIRMSRSAPSPRAASAAW